MINTLALEGKKLFAVIDSNKIVIDCWCANTIEEAKIDNPEHDIIEVTLENSPFTIGEKYIKEEQ